MPNHQQPGVQRNCLHSITPAFQIPMRYPDFGFWDAGKASYSNKFSNLDASELEFQVERDIIEGSGSCSPPLWEKNEGQNARYESSPLLPHNHQYSNLSSARQSQIAEGRKELMEMIENMPESCYELSLKDIVDEQHAAEEVNERMVEERSFLAESESEIKKKTTKKRVKKSMNAGQISRCGRMDTDTFLIKIFFPTSLGSNMRKKARAGISKSLSESEESDSHAEKEWWFKRIFTSGKNRGKVTSGSGSSHSSTSSINSSSSKSRHGNANSFSSCWLFFRINKSKIEE